MCRIDTAQAWVMRLYNLCGCGYAREKAEGYNHNQVGRITLAWAWSIRLIPLCACVVSIIVSITWETTILVKRGICAYIIHTY